MSSRGAHSGLHAPRRSLRNLKERCRVRRGRALTDFAEGWSSNPDHRPSVRVRRKPSRHLALEPLARQRLGV